MMILKLSHYYISMYLFYSSIYVLSQGPQPASMATIFENMVTLCIDLDMKEVINNIGLYLILKSCLHLKSLQINNQVCL